MARLSRTPGEGQNPLFDEAFEPFVPEQPGSPAEEVIPDVPGALVDIRYRAQELGAAFLALNAANRSAGLQQAGSSDPHRTTFDRRYGARRARQMVEGAVDREDSHLRDARTHFYRAAGYNALVASGYDEREAGNVVSELYRAFTARYGVGVTVASVRNRASRNITSSANHIVTGRPARRRRVAR